MQRQQMTPLSQKHLQPIDRSKAILLAEMVRDNNTYFPDSEIVFEFRVNVAQMFFYPESNRLYYCAFVKHRQNAKKAFKMREVEQMWFSDFEQFLADATTDNFQSGTPLGEFLDFITKVKDNYFKHTLVS